MSVDRRAFLGRTCACLGAIPVLDLASLSTVSGEQASAMKDMTARHLTQGYWSADSLLLSAAKHLEKPEETVAVAVGFGGGLLRKDLCGFLTGGVMAIGLFCNASQGSDRAGREKCHRLTKEYMEWWEDNRPLHCSEIGEPCDYRSLAAESSDYLQAMFARESDG
jgi:C_GCAxxG_C_C family probable redox protein